MTPDDTPIPSDDATASAARRGLDRLAESGTPELSWDAVQSGAHQLRRRRLAAVAAACTVVVLFTGIAFAAAGRNDESNLNVADGVQPTITTIPAPSSTTTAPPSRPTTTITGTTLPGFIPTTTTSPQPSAVAPGIEGTLTLASSTWVAEAPASFTLTVHNMNDHEYRFGPEMTLGIVVQGGSTGCVGVNPADLVLGPDEQRTFTSEFTPRPDMIGPATILTAVLYTGDNFSSCFSSDAFSGIPAGVAEIVPPGWTNGQPLDPSQGTWRATVSADSTDVTAGNSDVLHVVLHNAGSQEQRTNGYGALALVCRGSGIEDGVSILLDARVLEPGTSQGFVMDFASVQADSPGTYVCSIGMTFHGVSNPSSSSQHIDSDILGITVHTGGEPTTTLPPNTTIPTTTP